MRVNLPVKVKEIRPIVDLAPGEVFEVFEGFCQVAIGFLTGLTCCFWNLFSSVKRQQNGDERHGVFEVVQGASKSNGRPPEIWLVAF